MHICKSSYIQRLCKICVINSVLRNRLKEMEKMRELRRFRYSRVSAEGWGRLKLPSQQLCFVRLNQNLKLLACGSSGSGPLERGDIDPHASGLTGVNLPQSQEVFTCHFLCCWLEERLASKQLTEWGAADAMLMLMRCGLVQLEPAVSGSAFSFLQIANLASLNCAVRCFQNQG